MNTFKLTDDLKRLYFYNSNMIDESIIYRNVLSILKEQSNIILNSEELLPFADVTRGIFKTIPFYVVLDLNYGTYIRCDDQKCLNEIELILQNN